MQLISLWNSSSFPIAPVEKDIFILHVRRQFSWFYVIKAIVFETNWTNHLTILSVYLQFQLIFKMFISFSFCLWELFCACLSVDLSMLRDSLSPIHPLTRDSFSFSLRGSAAKERVVISVAKLPWNIRVTELMFRTFHVELLVFHGFFYKYGKYAQG